MDEVVAKYYTKKDAGKYKVLEDSVTTEKYVIGFRKDDKALCKEVIKQLKAMAKDGTLKKISTKWFDERHHNDQIKILRKKGLTKQSPFPFIKVL